MILEGVDGTGKTTVAEQLKQLIGSTAVIAKMPGATPLGQHLRQLHKNPQSINPKLTDIDPHTEQILMAADFSACIHWILTLPKETTIIFDRFNPISAVIYGTANGLDPCWTQQMISSSIPEQTPGIDGLYILSVPFEVSMKRRQQRNGGHCRIEARGNSFLEKVWGSYETFLSSNYRPVPIRHGRMINADQPINDVVQQIWADWCEWSKQ